MCDVVDCNKEVVRHIPIDKVSDILNLKHDVRKVGLCKEHYKVYKKKTKKDRDLERLTWM